MQSPATASAIQEAFNILEESAKHEPENVIRGVESYHMSTLSLSVHQTSFLV